MVITTRGETQEIPVPEPDLTPREMLARAAGKLAWRAMETIWTAAPVDAAKRSAPMARYYRDISMYRLHASSRQRFLGPQLGAIHFGLTDEVVPAGPG